MRPRSVFALVGGAVGILLVVVLTLRERSGDGPPPPTSSSASPRPSARPAARPLAPRPARSGAGIEEREERLVALLEGRIALEALPETATDPGDAWDPASRETLMGAPSTPRPARARATEGSVSVDGPLPVSDARRVLAAALARVRNCYQAVLEGDPSLRGVVRARLTVSSGGHVASIRDDQTQFPQSGQPTGVRCMVSVWRGLVFPAAAAESTVSYSVTLRAE